MLLIAWAALARPASFNHQHLASALTSNRALLVLVELPLHEAQNEAGFPHRRLPQEDEFELADFVPSSRSIRSGGSTSTCHCGLSAGVPRDEDAGDSAPDPPGGRLQLEEEVRVSDTLPEQPYQFQRWF